MRRAIALLGLTVLASGGLGQTRIDRLDVSNRSDRIYAIIKEIDKQGATDRREENKEAQSDFFYHTRELRKRLSFPVKLVIASSVFFLSEEVRLADSTSFAYVFVRKGGKVIKIIQGVDTWTSLKAQADSFFVKTKE